MPKKVVKEFIVPKCTGKAFIVKKAQVLRVIDHEGPQVADIRFFNAHNYKEQFAARHSALLNSKQGIGGSKRLTKLYSKIPWENIMLTVVHDRVGRHVMGGHCSRMVWELLNSKGHRSCSDNFEECLREYRIPLEDLDSGGCFNVFMNTEYNEDGTWYSVPPLAKKGDYIDFLAEMDVLVAFSNCPADNACNAFECKNMKVQIFE